MSIPATIGKHAYIATRPLVNVKLAKSTIDHQHLKAMLADVVISHHSHKLMGAAHRYRFGSQNELLRTASHVKLLAHAYHAGLSSVIVADEELVPSQVDFSRMSRVLAAAAASAAAAAACHDSNNTGVVIQMATSSPDVAAATATAPLLTAPLLAAPLLVPRPPNTFGTSLYAVIGRSALRKFATLWEPVDDSVMVPFRVETFVADYFLFHWLDSPALFAPGIVRSSVRSNSDWSGIAHVSLRRILGDCVACETGMYGYAESSNKNAVCKDCDAGQYTSETGQSVCVECSAGRHGNAAKKKQVSEVAGCLVCDVGRYVENEGHVGECFHCAPGHFISDQRVASSNHDSQEDCQQCPAGKYQEQEGAASCSICGAGTYNDELGATSCKKCGLGRYDDSGSDDNALKVTMRDDIEDCQQCPAGKEGDGAGGATSESAGCSSCQAGLFTKKNGSKICRSCPSGFHQEKTTQIKCDLCPAGSTSSKLASISCDLCGKGKYLSEQMRGEDSKCLPCSTADAGATGCSGCPAGRTGTLIKDDVTTANPSPGCDLCHPGEFSTGKCTVKAFSDSA